MFAGISREPSGAALLDGRAAYLLDEHTRRPALARLALSAAGRVAPRYLAALAAERPALVHAHFLSSGVAALPIARALGVPLVVTVHGYDVLDTRVSARDARRREALFARAARLVAVSDFLRERLLALGCPPAKAVRHYIGTDLDEPDETARDPSPRVLFVGRLVAHKGCRDALEAFARVRAARPEARLSIVGDGPERAALERRAREIGGVEFHGVLPPPAVRHALARAWVLCNPSGVGDHGWQEAFGLVFIEAQARRTPVVSTRTGGIGEAVADGTSGYTVASGDTAALAERLLALLGDTGLRRRMGAAGRERVAERFDIAEQGVALERLYTDVLRGDT